MKKQFCVVAAAFAVLATLTTSAFTPSARAQTSIVSAKTTDHSLDAQFRDSVMAFNVDKMRGLLRRGADPNVKGSDAFATPVLCSVCSDIANLEVAQVLVEGGADLEASNSQGATPLILACAGGRVEIVRFLSKSGANIEAKTLLGLTPLMFAASSGNAETVRVLMAAGANVNVRSNDNGTALIYGSSKTITGTGNLEIIKMLVAAGADVSVEATNGKNASETAYNYGLTDINHYLIDTWNRDLSLYNAVVDYQNRGTVDAVAQAANWQKVKNALAAGANPRFADRTSGITTLMILAHSSPPADDATIQTIIAHSDLNAQAKQFGETALHRAADGDNAQMVALLLKAGANPDILDKKKQTPLDVALAGKRQHVIPLLQNAKAKANPLEAFDVFGMFEKLRQPIGPDDIPKAPPIENPLARDENGSTKLMLLAEKKPFDATKAAALVKAGVDVNATDIFDYTALLSACEAGSPDAVRFLLQNGAKPNVLGRRNNTALILAAKLDSGTDAFDIVTQLIAAGADVNVKNKNGDTALSLAVEHLNGLAASALHNAGAK